MNRIKVKRALMGWFLLALMAIPAIGTSAATLYWDGTGTSWSSLQSWSTDSANPDVDPLAVPGSGDIATFNISTVNSAQTVNLNGNQAASQLVVNSTGAVTIQGGDADRILSLGTGPMTLSAGAGPLTIGSATAGQKVNISLQGSQNWANSSGATSTSGVTIHNNVSLGVGGSATLTLSGNTPNTVTNAINGVISDGSGTLSLTLSGSGTGSPLRWTLAGANTYSGATTIGAGGIRLTNGNGLGSTAGATTVNAGGGLFLDAVTVLGETLTLNGDGPSGSSNGALQALAGTSRWTGNITVNTGSGTGRIGTTSNSSLLILDGTLTGTGTGQLVFQTGTSTSTGGTVLVNGSISYAGQRVTKSATGSSAGRVILNASNNYGETIISSGIIQVGNGGTTGTLGSGNVSLGGGTSTIAFKRSDNITISNVISASGGGASSGTVQHLGTGTLTLNAANNLSGATDNIGGGTLQLDFTSLATPTNIVGTGAFTTTGSKLNLLGKTTGTSSQTFASTTIGAGHSTISLDSNGGTATNLALGAITRSTGGTVTFTLPANGSITTTTANTATSILAGYATVGDNTWAVSAGDGTNAGAITALPEASYSSSLSTTADLDVPNGGGTLGANPNSIRFNNTGANTLTLDAARAVTSGGILVTSNVGANLSQISGNFALTTGNGQDLIIFQNNAAGGLTINAQIGSAIAKSGDGLLTLTANSTASFITRINAGTVSVAEPSDLGGGTNVIVFPTGSTGTIQFTGANTFSSAKTITLTGNGIVDVPDQATLSNSTSAVSGAGNLTKTGGGTLFFSSATNANTFTGALIIKGGIVSVTRLANAGTASGIGAATSDAGNLVLDGGVLRLSPTAASPAETDRLFTLGLSGGGFEASGTGANTMSFTNTGAAALSGSGPRTFTLTGSNTGANLVAAILGDNGGPTSVSKSGTGTWTLSGANTYSGTTGVNAGTLLVNGTHTNAGNYTVAPNATLGGAGGVITLASGRSVNATGTSGNLATIAPGSGIGTLTVNAGDGVILGDHGNLAIELAGASADQLRVGGNLDLQSTLDRLTISGTADGVTSYVIATYGGALNGTFASITNMPANYTIDYGTGFNSQITLAVPEPGSMALLGLCAAAVLMRRRR